jgi:hypothetical protein
MLPKLFGPRAGAKLSPARKRRPKFVPALEALERRDLLAAAFTWAMTPRFTSVDESDVVHMVDLDGDHLTDMLNDPAYIQQTKFQVTLDAGTSVASGTTATYKWRFLDEFGAPVSTTAGASVFIDNGNNSPGQARQQIETTSPTQKVWFDTPTDPALANLRERSFYVSLEVIPANAADGGLPVRFSLFASRTF